MARFFSIFVLFVALGIALVTRPEVASAISGPWAEFLAEAAHRIIAMWDSSTILSGTVIRDPATGFAVSVDTECTGIDPIVIFGLPFWHFQQIGSTRPSGWSSA